MRGIVHCAAMSTNRAPANARADIHGAVNAGTSTAAASTPRPRATSPPRWLTDARCTRAEFEYAGATTSPTPKRCSRVRRGPARAPNVGGADSDEEQLAAMVVGNHYG